MSRRRRAEKRQVLPDPKFGDLTVTPAFIRQPGVGIVDGAFATLYRDIHL